MNKYPTYNQIYLISKLLNALYEEQFKKTKYKSFFNQFNNMYKDDYNGKKFYIPKGNKDFVTFEYEDIQNTIEFLKEFNKKDKKDMDKFKKMFVLE